MADDKREPVPAVDWSAAPALGEVRVTPNGDGSYRWETRTGELWLIAPRCYKDRYELTDGPTLTLAADGSKEQP